MSLYKLLSSMFFVLFAVNSAVAQETVIVTPPKVVSVDYMSEQLEDKVSLNYVENRLQDYVTTEQLEVVKTELDAKADANDSRFYTIPTEQPAGDLPQGQAFVWVD